MRGKIMILSKDIKEEIKKISQIIVTEICNKEGRTDLVEAVESIIILSILPPYKKSLLDQVRVYTCDDCQTIFSGFTRHDTELEECEVCQLTFCKECYEDHIHQCEE